MLGLTEMNGCALCSYVHTKLTLSAGLSKEDIKELLVSDLDGVLADEALGILFRKDYAFTMKK